MQKSWRDAVYERLSEMIEISPPPKGFKISRAPISFWRNRLTEAKAPQ